MVAVPCPNKRAAVNDVSSNRAVILPLAGEAATELYPSPQIRLPIDFVQVFEHGLKAAAFAEEGVRLAEDTDAEDADENEQSPPLLLAEP